MNGTLTGYDAGGNVVAQDGPRQVAADVFTTSFEITVATASIVRAVLAVGDSAHEAIDDLEFDGQAAPPVPTTPPVVQITSPVNGADLDVSSIDISGTVTGDGLISPVKLTMTWGRPPEQASAPPFTSDLSLTGTGTTRQFSLPGFTNVPLGPITVTVAAQNTGNLTGTGTSTFTNLPGGIRDRFQAQGGAAVLGAFQFGLVDAACKIAVYEHGAVTDDKLFIGGDIFTKWLSLKGPSNQTGWFGCPLADERGGDQGTRVQDFEGGRIYANLPAAAPPATAYVPAVFVDALVKRGDEAANGVPLADPSDSSGPMQTWLFQQFGRPPEPNGNVLLPTTLEIRGTPPTLWMERQAGSWFLSALAATSADVALNRSAATLWESFPASGNLGPATVDQDPPFPPPNISNAGALFCNSSTYWPGHPGGPPEWAAIPSYKGDYVATPVFGAIISNFYADIDNAFTHEHTFGNCPYCLDTIGGATTPLAGLCPTCPSDYEFKVRPIGPEPGAFPRPSLFGQGNLDNIKVEYELYYAAAAHSFLGAPQQGDLVYATGRWIIDCGHDEYKSELHPIFSLREDEDSRL